MKRSVPFGLSMLLTAVALATPAAEKPVHGRAAIAGLSRDPYQGAIVINAADGKVVFEDRADEKCYPASTLKLMDLLIVLEKVQQGVLKLDDKVRVTAESSLIGGTQVFLAENEEFTIDELLYALMVQSANDAATALAIHVAGTKQGFVDLMNERAKQLGMTSTSFNSVHGLPPGAGQTPDVTTARDFALLCRELVVKHPETMKYTATTKRVFRPAKPFNMETHNNLLGAFEGCDGLKTGYYKLAGFSIAATAQRKDARMIAVVLGSTDKKIRDTKAKELLAKGFLAVPAPAIAPPPPPVPAAAPATPVKKR